MIPISHARQVYYIHREALLLDLLQNEPKMPKGLISPEDDLLSQSFLEGLKGQSQAAVLAHISHGGLIVQTPRPREPTPLNPYHLLLTTIIRIFVTTGTVSGNS